MPDTIKALTIHQPFAHLIVTPQSELPPGAIQKRIENRRWPTSYRGPLVIHAGKSLDWIDEEDWPPTPDKDRLAFSDFPEFAFGAFVGVAMLSACLHVSTVHSGLLPNHLAWAQDHHHAEGPYCWILENARRFKRPFAYRGAQGLFNVPAELVREQLECADAP